MDCESNGLDRFVGAVLVIRTSGEHRKGVIRKIDVIAGRLAVRLDKAKKRRDRWWVSTHDVFVTIPLASDEASEDDSGDILINSTEPGTFIMRFN